MMLFLCQETLSILELLFLFNGGNILSVSLKMKPFIGTIREKKYIFKLCIYLIECITVAHQRLVQHCKSNILLFKII